MSSKPELYLPGGREYLRMKASGGCVEVGFGAPQRLFGLSAASPDFGGQARTSMLALSDGTSSATALGTRAAHRIFDALMDADVPSQLRQMDPKFYAVVVKALLVHRARWNGKAELLREICGPEGSHRGAERSENVCRFMGFGVPNIEEALECAAHRATLVGFGSLGPDKSLVYRVPLPPSLERVREPRWLTVTVAWLSPVKSRHRSYRCVRIEAAPLDPPQTFAGFGEIRVPRELWDAMRRFAVWIEPALIAEWQRLMRLYGQRQDRALDEAAMAAAMVWAEPSRDVALPRQLALRLIESGPGLHCIWSGRRLDAAALDIDHCLPWSAWPCGDLWNLLPAHRTVNQHQKRERLPSDTALRGVRAPLLEWWQSAYLEAGNIPPRRFLDEARASLPGLADAGDDTASPDAVFTALGLQRLRLRHDQGVPEWAGVARQA